MTIPVRVGVGTDPLRPFDTARWWAQIELMEELGFDSVWLPDAVGFGGAAPLPALAAAATRTERSSSASRSRGRRGRARRRRVPA